MNRVKLNFNHGWKFIKEDIPCAYDPAYVDTEWETVSAPHTYNDIDTFDNFMESGHNGERDMFTGKTWYRKHFKLDEAYNQRKVFIEFESVRQAADVYVNGHKLVGKSETGFIPFGYDLTPYLYFGKQENIIAIRVDNSFPYKAEGTHDILSWHDSHWHPTHGGLYRNIYLHITDLLHITLPLYSYLKSQGTYVYTSNIKKEFADVTMEAEIHNEYPTQKSVTCFAEVVDVEGNIVLQVQESKTIKPNEKVLFSQTGRILTTHRWSPDYPYMYKVVHTVEIAGKRVDVYETPLGIRTFSFDPQSGFWINGRNVKLRGWGQKSTNEWAGLGAAYPDWMQAYVLRMMKDAGANFVRWGHCAGAPIHIKTADQYGIITLQPGVDGEGSTVGGIYSETAYQIRTDAFRDLVIYYRNNPSILLWEGGNQSVPDLEAQTLKAQVTKWDPHGGRAYAHRRSNEVMADYIDVSIGTEGCWELKEYNKPVVEGEYNREEAARRVWDRKTLGYEDYKTSDDSSYNLTSEEFAKNQVAHYKKISDRSHCGGANWIFSDSTSHGRVRSEVARASGEVDGVMLPKEAYYAVKSIFREDPQIHIIGHWNYPVGTEKDIYVVSNTDKTELFINGRSQGFGLKSDTYLFTFKNILWEAGVIKAIGYDTKGEILSTQEKKTAGEPSRVKLTPMVGPKGLQATGSDILLVDAEVVDEEGNRCPTFEGRIDFSITGPGIWRGGYNSGREYSTNHMYLDIEAGVNRVAIRSTLIPGEIRLTGRVLGLKSETISVKSKDQGKIDGVELPMIHKYILPTIEPPVGDEEQQAIKNNKLTPRGQTLKNYHRLIKDFSYSGIHELCTVETNLQKGDRLYSDSKERFEEIPEYLLGGDYIKAPNNDRLFEALDLIQFTVTKDVTVYIGHDERINLPGWIKGDFEKINEKIMSEKGQLSLFKKEVSAYSSLTLGGNVDGGGNENSNMYVVIVKEVTTA